MLEMFILLSVVGAFAGLLAGLFGVGGGMQMPTPFRGRLAARSQRDLRVQAQNRQAGLQWFGTAFSIRQNASKGDLAHLRPVMHLALMRAFLVGSCVLRLVAYGVNAREDNAQSKECKAKHLFCFDMHQMPRGLNFRCHGRGFEGKRCKPRVLNEHI